MGAALLGALISFPLFTSAVAAPPTDAPTPTVEPTDGTPVAAEPPQIDLVIVGPGADTYTLFGHVTLTVRDAGQPRDAAQTYNFGVTDFRTDGIVQRFATGRVDYWAEVEPYADALENWIGQDRTVVRYPLNLGAGATRRLAGRLERAVHPDHRHYVYDTFRTNCSTRVRDLLDTYTGGAVYGALGTLESGRAYRDDVRDAYAGSASLLLLSEFVAGVSMDDQRTQWELGYLPAHLERGLVTVDLPNGAPLLGAPVIDHSRAGADPREGWAYTHHAFFLFLAAMAGLLAYLAPRLAPRVRGGLLLAGVVVYTTLGLLLLALQTTSDWPDLQRNWLLAAALPLDAFLIWPALRLASRAEVPGRISRKYMIFRLGLTGLVVALTPLVLAGPWAPKWAALAGLVALWRLMGKVEKKAETAPERLYTRKTGEYPALSRARKRRTV